MNLLEAIPIGENNKISSKGLKDMCGFKTVRHLQKAIEALRCEGHIICSTAYNGGYYRYADIGELRNYVRTCEARARNTFRSLSPARKVLRELEKAE